jgi:hypothetical protein
MTRAPAGAGDLVAAPGCDDAFDVRFPTQPIPVGRHQVGLVLDDRHTRAPDAASRRMSPAYLDSTTSAEVLEHLRRSVRELGQTVVMVTHDRDAAGYADDVVTMADGRIA